MAERRISTPLWERSHVRRPSQIKRVGNQVRTITWTYNYDQPRNLNVFERWYYFGILSRGATQPPKLDLDEIPMLFPKR